MTWLWNALSALQPKDIREWILLLTAAVGWLHPIWRRALNRWLGDREMARQWRFDVMYRYESDPRVLCRLLATGAESVKLESIRVLAPKNWQIAKIGEMKSYDGRITCRVIGQSSETISVLLEPEQFGSQWTNGMSMEGFAYWFFVSPRTMTSEGESGGCQGLDASRLSMTVAIVPTLCAIRDNRRVSFIKLRSQPIEEAKLIPSKTP